MKIILRLFVLFFIVKSVILFGNNKESDIQKIASNTSYNETINVIIKFNVPDIRKLTNASQRFKSGITYASYKKENAKTADKSLSSAIKNVAFTVLHSLGGNTYTTNHIYKTIPYIVMSINKNTLKKFRTIDSVKRIYLNKKNPLPNFIKKTLKKDNSLSSPLLNDSTSIIGADTAWNLGLTGKGWYIAIMDTGIRTTHEMFTGKRIIEKCYSDNKNCPNNKKEMTGVGSATHYYQHSDIFGYDHGTHVSGIAAGNNHSSLFGIAKDANIIAVQVFSYFPEINDIRAWDSDILKGLEYVYSLRNSYKIASVNMSLGGDKSYSSVCDDDVLKPAIDNLRAVGIATIVASGNDMYCRALSSPACISSAISVDATSKNDQECFFGNWSNKMLDLLAPGSLIKSAIAKDNSSYETWVGTSMAAPHVAGAWAILKQFNPNFTVKELLKKFKDDGVQIAQRASCYNNSVTKPRIDLGATISKLSSILPPNTLTVSKEINNSVLETEYINCLTWIANPYNAGNKVARYNIYILENNSLNLLISLNANTFSYNHRNVKKYTSIVYAITSVSKKGAESIPLYYTIIF